MMQHLQKVNLMCFQEGKAGKRVLVYQDVLVDGKVVATNLLSGNSCRW